MSPVGNRNNLSIVAECPTRQYVAHRRDGDSLAVWSDSPLTPEPLVQLIGPQFDIAATPQALHPTDYHALDSWGVGPGIMGPDPDVMFPIIAAVSEVESWSVDDRCHVSRHSLVEREAGEDFYHMRMPLTVFRIPGRALITAHSYVLSADRSCAIFSWHATRARVDADSTRHYNGATQLIEYARYQSNSELSVWTSMASTRASSSLVIKRRARTGSARRRTVPGE
ncbi:hypothetical protein SAMN02910418_01053 [Bowdeniella nasicola]|uniref:Uncharacterized protein n=1 Tax=Bowdeniella nasicola TaxID=208480 RepID=A0A1H3YZZ9_9ACTO|nr:hypothetical protein SAMN02910418_01053 [Bowdeniella nasicola]